MQEAKSLTNNVMLRNEIEKIYIQNTPKSRAMFALASKFMPGGQSHNSRFFEPYPFFSERGEAQHLWDVDGNRYTDYWMGHTALILGHSPNIVAKELQTQVSKGLLLGTPNKYAFELARIVSEIVPCAEGVRFCTTGAEATMYAVRLARAYTGRSQIVKMAGGWHGYNASLTYAVNQPYQVPESAGLIPEEQSRVKVASFNSEEEASRLFEENGREIAAVILEPVMGGGVLPATKKYLKALRSLCSENGALLIFDEVITGFRLSLGGAQEFYGITPDLCTLGKILGGGLPASAVAGMKEIMSLVDTTSGKGKSERAWIGGGTFSEHALSMRAGLATLKHLKTRKNSIYPSLSKKGNDLRRSIDRSFARHGIRALSTGEGSLFATHFLEEDQREIVSPRDLGKSRHTEHLFGLSLIAQYGIFLEPGHVAAISTAHTASDLSSFASAAESFAESLSSS
jgi:glutamate-1-semialdehyde 2,1-aminomutase